ncbi:hypothetical protein [Polyangium jinanense]|uniref:Uncharacterized protein n=1 Tax=Polyangium jinanense TaxID=2829994 RepID=A0A9X3XB75_9BACT|nr:hypothetical protein [Polyangium jinanense]MDC3960853.1 hypothetical protein [Polyangium jinanense]MDC3984676.1 hypothetical protein [Polyangium jinanense]
MGKHLYLENTKGDAGELPVAGFFGISGRQSPSRDQAASESCSTANRGLEPLDTGGS